jgi:hypothetical protein
MPVRIPRAAGSGKLFLAALFLLTLSGSPLQAADPAADFLAGGQGTRFPELSNGTLTPLPSLEAYYLDGQAIEVDGVLDEAFWSEAHTGWGFQQHEPDRGTSASVPTTFKVVYDDDAIYFGVACWEADMADVAGFLSRRDEIQASDLVSVYIDPYLDRTTGYNFRVTPDGVLYDAYLFDNGNRDNDWNAVWDAEVTRDDRGWYVEIRIPFSAIRFKPQPDMTWGLQVYRWLHSRGEDTGWVTWDRNASGFVSRWGTLTGLRGVENPRKLEILPYVVTKATDPATPVCEEDSWKNFQNFGADFKYGITSNLTLNATFQPDFGQVEADPAILNLSPFETYYAEKRPFFTEGARFFQHPDFNLFYSRRIGTGDPNSRIRGAAKLTGKIGGDFSVAVLGAATDVGQPGKTHNPFASGDQKAYYGLVRVGKEFNEGNHYVNVMGTAVKRDEASFAGITDPRLLRDGYSGGMDFEMNFADRMYRIHGSAVGTMVEPFGDPLDPSLPGRTTYGTGGRLDLRKSGGRVRGVLIGGWESDQLDPNDMGFLAAPDEKFVQGAASYHYDSDGEDKPFNTAVFELEASGSWFYAGNTGYDLNTGAEAWSYGGGHRQDQELEVFIQGQHRTYHQGWVYLSRHLDGTSKYATRSFNGQPGPLMTQPGWTNAACGLTTDWRRPLSLSVELHGDWGDDVEAYAAQMSLRWNQNRHLFHSIGFGVRHNISGAHWITNRANDGAQPGVTGIGGVDYVFGELDQMIWDMTLRTSVLFNRDQSLQLYLQPYLTYGDYADPHWLATPDSYDLRPYDLDVGAYDFKFAALNLNMVYRWEYRPGSTVYLVWTHSKQRYDVRGHAPDPYAWDNDFDLGYVTDSEPRNTFLAKVSYWFSI